MTLMSVSSNEAGDFRSKPRWSANRKIDVVLRLLRGESLEEVSREVGVEAHRLQAWRDDFLESGKQGLKQRLVPGPRGIGACRRRNARSAS
jgi:transposase-like protein